MARTLPELVSKLCFAHEGWIIGSAVEQNKPRDYDVVIPFSHWKEASMLIPRDAKPNAMGGWKCISEDIEVDVWPADLGTLICHRDVETLWHPKSRTIFNRQ